MSNVDFMDEQCIAIANELRHWARLWFEFRIAQSNNSYAALNVNANAGRIYHFLWFGNLKEINSF